MSVEALVDTLLYEGYALYPYTPGATKNATPTPFGIVYPPAYAEGLPSTFSHLRLECVAEAPSDAELHAEVRFLHPSGTRHEAAEQRLALPSAALGERVSQEFEADGLRLRMTVRSEVIGDGRFRVRSCVHNLTEAEPGLDRAGALLRSLISTHPLLRLSAGRFISPLEAPCDSVNTWPVLAATDDSAVLGAAIVLPDHPQIAPESRGSLFDATEIEEALLLHVQALSEGERAEIAEQDPVVREMIERAETATPEDLLRLHGRVTVRDPLTTAPPTPSAAVTDPTRGEERVEADGKVFCRGGKVVLRPGPEADLHARLAAGRTATLERIYIDLDGKVHLGVTIDGDPGQELMRETNRLLFFFAPEVEVIA